MTARRRAVTIALLILKLPGIPWEENDARRTTEPLQPPTMLLWTNDPLIEELGGHRAVVSSTGSMTSGAIAQWPRSEPSLGPPEAPWEPSRTGWNTG